jgi:type I restriction enzyme S subunit
MEIKKMRDVASPVLLGECVSPRSGKTPSRNRLDFWFGTTPWYSAKDLKSFRLTDSEEHISAAALADGAPVAKAGEVLVLVRGMTLMKDVPIGVLCQESSFNQDIKCLRPKDGIRSIYLGYMLAASRPRLLSMVDQAGHGTGRLALDRLLSLPIWKPSDGVQLSVETALSIVDRHLEQLRLLIDAKRMFARGLARQLLTGQKRFPGFVGSPWRKTTIGEVLEEASRPIAWDEEATYTLVSVRRRSSGIFLRERKRGSAIKVKALYEIRRGDILISTRQVVHGAISKVPAQFDGSNVSGEYMVLVPKQGAAILPEYFDHMTRLPRMYRAAFLASYGVDIEKLTFNSEWYLQSGIEIPASTDEQARIASVLDACDLEIDQLVTLGELVEAQKRALLSKLLSGEIAVQS